MRWLGIGLVLWGCGVEGTDVPDAYEILTPREQLIRLSVDLRGVHPTEAELQAIEARPSLYVQAVETYLEDPRFLDQVERIVNDRLLMKVDDTYFEPSELGLASYPREQLVDAMAGEPMQLVRKIVAEGLPWSTLVTADYTMANPLLSSAWGMQYPDGATGWQPSHYVDGRPHAGLLSMTTTWRRYPSMGGNANRHRANAISKMLLCDDFLERPIILSRSAVDQLVEDPETAINTNASCQSCHATLDPLSANLFGFFTYDDATGMDRVEYQPELEEGWRNYSGKEPGYYGQPTANLEELGQAIAEDYRFAQCATRTFWEGLTQRVAGAEEWGELERHTDAFMHEGQNVKSLVRSIVMHPSYLARSSHDADLDKRVPGIKTASPEQLVTLVDDLTGYRWEFDGRGMEHDARGLGVLAGGIDSQYVVERSHVPSVTRAFSMERLAQAAAYHVVEHDLDPMREGEARLLAYVTDDMTPETSPKLFEAQVKDLYLRVTGKPLPEDAVEPEEMVALWKGVYSVEASPRAAWSALVSVVLRDPDLLFY